MDTSTQLKLLRYLQAKFESKTVDITELNTTKQDRLKFECFLNTYTGEVRKEASKLKDEDPLTTGQVAKILRVASRTVTKAFDEGLLEGYRIPCGSRDRRIFVSSLRDYMVKAGMPINWLEDYLADRKGKRL